MEGAKFADRHGFKAIWTPERHFYRFGGLYPNPSVLGAALAVATERIQIRAGSVVLPLHHPVRVAEEWAVVDNLSRGRVGLAFASGFVPTDFVFAPDNFATRRDVMFEGIDTVKQLWRGESVRVLDGNGAPTEVAIYPKPVQPELPVWLVTARNEDTFVEAGKIGANVLTSLILLSVEEVAQRIALYRETLAKNGHDPEQGQVTLMLHTFLGDDIDKVRETVREPFYDYLRSHLEMIKTVAANQNINMDEESLPVGDREALLSFAFERYFNTTSLCGTPSSCRSMIERLSAIGVNEIACLIDFGVDVDSTMMSLQHLSALKEQVAQG